MTKFTLRRIIMTFTLVLTAIFLIACTNNSTDKNEVKHEKPTLTEDKAQEASSDRLFTDAMGREVELPKSPERIIAHFYASEMVAINQPIIGTNFNNATEVLSKEQLKEVTDIGGDGVVPNLEKMLALNPDLIIVPNFLEENDVNELAKIAPTVVIDYSSDINSRLNTLGEIIGKPENAEKWIEDYTAKSEVKREEVKPFIAPGETASAFIIYEGKQLYVYGPQRLGPIMYDALGYSMPPKVEEMFLEKPDSLWEMISLEVLPEYSGDVIFLLAPDDSEESKKMIEEVINGPIWKTIPAVKNGKAYVVEDRWAFNDPMTLDWLLDEMPKTISK